MNNFTQGDDYVEKRAKKKVNQNHLKYSKHEFETEVNQYAHQLARLKQTQSKADKFSRAKNMNMNLNELQNYNKAKMQNNFMQKRAKHANNLKEDTEMALESQIDMQSMIVDGSDHDASDLGDQRSCLELPPIVRDNPAGTFYIINIFYHSRCD